MNLSFKHPYPFLEIDIPSWYGLKDSSSCLFEFWIQDIPSLGLGNCGISILLIRFWENFYIEYKFNFKRICVGIGFVSFFISFKK